MTKGNRTAGICHPSICSRFIGDGGICYDTTDRPRIDKRIPCLCRQTVVQIKRYAYNYTPMFSYILQRVVSVVRVSHRCADMLSKVFHHPHLRVAYGRVIE